jgi:outer membrane protein assembly factor BamD
LRDSGLQMTEYAHSHLPAHALGRRATALISAALVVVAGLALSACNTSTEGTKAAYAEDEPAGNLYNAGLAYMNAGKLNDAVKSFNEVDRQHPYSEYARKALIMSAYASYKRGKYDDASNTAQRYLTLYPGTEDAAYAQYIIAQSHYNRIPDITRDQAETKKAMAAMEEVLDRFPDSEYADDARTKVIQTRDQVAGKEMQVGRYYLERREYIAAVNRFKTVVTTYQDTRHVEEALYRLVEANLALGIVPEAQTAGAVLGHNFPDSEWYQRAYKRLGGVGVEPEDNKGSWISRAFGLGKTT